MDKGLEKCWSYKTNWVCDWTFLFLFVHRSLWNYRSRFREVADIPRNLPLIFEVRMIMLINHVHMHNKKFRVMKIKNQNVGQHLKFFFGLEWVFIYKASFTLQFLLIFIYLSFVVLPYERKTFQFNESGFGYCARVCV